MSHRSTEAESRDTLLSGRLTILQAKKGYRFSLDAVLLAHFARDCVKPARVKRIIDLGSGNGVLALLLAGLHRSAKVVGLEIQNAMVGRAMRSVELNGLERRVEILQGDVRDVEHLFPPESFDAAVCNPPYRPARSGRISPNEERRIARHEINGSLSDFLRAASYLLPQGSGISLVYPASRAIDLLAAMRHENLEPKRLRLVHSFAGSPAALVLVHGINGGRTELFIGPPLTVYNPGRTHTSEIKAMLG